MKQFLERNFPPGFAYRSEGKAIAIALTVAVLISQARFLNDYSAARQALYLYQGGQRVLDESAMMADFGSILADKLLILLVLAGLLFVLTALAHYLYFYSGSKSIYLMRRLPNRYELPRRCLLLPLLTALAVLLLTALLLLIDYAIYQIFTPAACL